MKNLAKAMVGTVAAGAMAVSAVSPALARDRSGGIDAGEVIAGAIIIGGIAAVVSAASNNKRDRYGYRYGRDYRDGRDYRYERAGYNYNRGNPRKAVSKCVRAAERGANRHSYGRADVTQIRDVRRKRNGYDVRGRISVNEGGRQWRKSGYDTGRFTCKIRHGRIADIRYRGIRGFH
ncbi:MAG: hypothetical protein KUG65_02070 [Sphingomonadaceae bacterium]|nr:hypothetical protein [Sphingomonadaceae bacterium]